MSTYPRCNVRKPKQKDARAVLELPAGVEGFFLVLAHHAGAGRKFVVSGTFPDGDAALTHAKGVCAAMCPFDPAGFHFCVEFWDATLAEATEVEEIDPDAPIPYQLAGQENGITPKQEAELMAAGRVEDMPPAYNPLAPF